jgi:hypothetical protein
VPVGNHRGGWATFSQTVSKTAGEIHLEIHTARYWLAITCSPKESSSILNGTPRHPLKPTLLPFGRNGLAALELFRCPVLSLDFVPSYFINVNRYIWISLYGMQWKGTI